MITRFLKYIEKKIVFASARYVKAVCLAKFDCYECCFNKNKNCVTNKDCALKQIMPSDWQL